LKVLLTNELRARRNQTGLHDTGKWRLQISRVSQLSRRLAAQLKRRIARSREALSFLNLRHMQQSVRDLEIHCAQLESSLEQMGGVIPPPRHLQIRVAGTYYPEFIEHGVKLLGFLEKALDEIDRPLPSFQRILDFGCGCSRVLQAARLKAGPAPEFHGTDLDGEAIAWCQVHHSRLATFAVNDPYPPLKYAAATFDLVYSVSVFTHLPEDMLHAWLAELRRVSQPGAILLLTTFGERCFKMVPERERQDALRKGFHYFHQADTAGLPKFYQTAVQTPDYIRSRWSEYFAIVKIHEGGVDDWQDIVVCRRP
jgi:SAM-dependent methyltransferase